VVFDWAPARNALAQDSRRGSLRAFTSGGRGWFYRYILGSVTPRLLRVRHPTDSPTVHSTRVDEGLGEFTESLLGIELTYSRRITTKPWAGMRSWIRP
jgi:hypothetical protein